MTISTILKVSIAVILLSPAFLSAEVPSNSLQIEFHKSNEQATNLLSMDTLYQIPINTYSYLDDVFTSFYNKVSFKSTITDSVLEANAHYELISIPLIAETAKGLQVEIFGNFSDPMTQRLSNNSVDQALSNHYSNTEMLNIYNSQLSVGAGFSFYTEYGDKIKIIISNSKIPGFGNSTALLGFETTF